MKYKINFIQDVSNVNQVESDTSISHAKYQNRLTTIKNKREPDKGRLSERFDVHSGVRRQVCIVVLRVMKMMFAETTKTIQDEDKLTSNM